jgi:hypothetical protein
MSRLLVSRNSKGWKRRRARLLAEDEHASVRAEAALALGSVMTAGGGSGAVEEGVGEALAQAGALAVVVGRLARCAEQLLSPPPSSAGPGPGGGGAREAPALPTLEGTCMAEEEWAPGVGQEGQEEEALPVEGQPTPLSSVVLLSLLQVLDTVCRAHAAMVATPPKPRPRSAARLAPSWLEASWREEEHAALLRGVGTAVRRPLRPVVRPF